RADAGGGVSRPAHEAAPGLTELEHASRIGSSPSVGLTHIAHQKMNGAHERQEGRKARQKAKSKRQKAALGRARPLEDSREKGLCVLRPPRFSSNLRSFVVARL